MFINWIPLWLSHVEFGRTQKVWQGRFVQYMFFVNTLFLCFSSFQLLSCKLCENLLPSLTATKKYSTIFCQKGAIQSDKTRQTICEVMGLFCNLCYDKGGRLWIWFSYLWNRPQKFTFSSLHLPGASWTEPHAELERQLCRPLTQNPVCMHCVWMSRWSVHYLYLPNWEPVH